MEGQIRDVVDGGDGRGTMTVMGIVIEIPDDIPIATPTAILTMEQFADARSLPGRSQPGFVGAYQQINVGFTLTDFENCGLHQFRDDTQLFFNGGAF